MDEFSFVSSAISEGLQRMREIKDSPPPKPMLKALNRVLQPRDSENKRFTKPAKERKSKIRQFY